MGDLDSSPGFITSSMILGRLANLHVPWLPQMPNDYLPSRPSSYKNKKYFFLENIKAMTIT